jgi:hypothetical protein
MGVPTTLKKLDDAGAAAAAAKRNKCKKLRLLFSKTMPSSTSKWELSLLKLTCQEAEHQLLKKLAGTMMTPTKTLKATLR